VTTSPTERNSTCSPGRGRASSDTWVNSPCTSWEFASRPDNSGNTRQAIIFHFVPASAAAGLDSDPAETQHAGMDLAGLRRRALDAAAPAQQSEPKEARRNYYGRSAAVREYVLARANGACEACGGQAPFCRKDGTPYLEPHRVRRLSDGGPYHPRFVAGVCPTCHRRVHHGSDGAVVNRALEEKLAALEAEVSGS
jgi:5-methylcytosine-specific restriction enzyme A